MDVRGFYRAVGSPQAQTSSQVGCSSNRWPAENGGQLLPSLLALMRFLSAVPVHLPVLPSAVVSISPCRYTVAGSHMARAGFH